MGTCKEPLRIALENTQLKRRLREITLEYERLAQEYRELARFAVERDKKLREWGGAELPR